MKAIRDLNQDHTQILRHGHRHLLKVLCLSFGAAAKFDLVEFAYTVYQISNGVAKLRLDCGLGDAGVFDYVVQHSGHQALMVHVHFAENAGYGEGMSDIGVATTTKLTFVGLFRIIIGATYAVDLVLTEITSEIRG